MYISHNVIEWSKFIFNLSEPAPLLDIKAKAVDEMMDRIKKGIILRPMKRVQVHKLYLQRLSVCLHFVDTLNLKYKT